jgi:hypothetical protein
MPQVTLTSRTPLRRSNQPMAPTEDPNNSRDNPHLGEVIWSAVTDGQRKPRTRRGVRCCRM